VFSKDTTAEASCRNRGTWVCIRPLHLERLDRLIVSAYFWRTHGHYGGESGAEEDEAAAGVSEILYVRREETFPRCGLPKVPPDRRQAARWESRRAFYPRASNRSV